MPDKPEHYPFQVAEFARNDNEVVRVTLDWFRGHETVGIRTFYRDAAGEWKPGRSGMSISTRHLPDLASALNAAVECAGKQLPQRNSRPGYPR